MNYCLDTSTVIAYFRKQQSIIDKLNQIDWQSTYITVVSIGELEVGYFFQSRKEGEQKRREFYSFIKRLSGVWSIDQEVAIEFGRIKADLKKKNQLVGDNDTWVAAICNVNKATLVTANKEHFKRVEGLKLF